MPEYDEWQCPNCGWDSCDSCEEEEMIDCTEERYVYAVALEFGGNPVEWDETWKCPECGNVFECTNSNF